MQRLWTLAALFGATFVVFVGSFAITASPVAAQSVKPAQDVRVVNTSSQSVPVSVQGTPSVNVGNSVAISSLPAVQLDGTPTVDIGNEVAISSLPAVQIDGTPSVSIANTDPIPVTMESGSRTPIDRMHSLTFPDGQVGGGDNVYTVPAGSLLVIERFFVHASIGAGGTFSLATLDRVNGDAATFPILMEKQGTDFNGRERFTGSIEGPFFFAAGTTVQGNYLRTGTGTTVMNWSFTGYLEEVP